MKLKKLILFLMIFFSAVQLNAEEKWLPPPFEGWHMTLESAVKAAQAEDKKILFIVGRDNQFTQEYIDRFFRSVAIRRFIQKKLIVLFLHNSGSRNIPESQVKYFTALRKKLRIYGWPSSGICDKYGRIQGLLDNCAAGDDFFESLKTAYHTSHEKFLQNEQKHLAMWRKKLKNSKFKIVSWGYSPDNVRYPFTPGKTVIKVKCHQKLYFKVKYNISSGEVRLWLDTDIGAATGRVSGTTKDQDECIRHLSISSPGIHNFLKIDVDIGGYILTARKIPCKIICR